jgi:hypothetical protein
VGDHSTGLLFNLSEGGLAVDGLLPDIQGDVFELALDLPEADLQIVGTAQAAWTGNSSHRTGMRFVHLSDSSRQRLKEWISAQVSIEEPPMPPLLTPVPAVAHRPVPRQPVLDSALPLRFDLEKPSVRYQPVRKRRAWRRTLSLILTIAPVSSALVLLGYYLANRGGYHPTQMLAAAPKLPKWAAPAPPQPAPSATPVGAPDVASDTPLAAPATSLPSTLSLDNPGFVIQVAAMEYEDNADALSNSLQKKNFPAFVYKRDSERLYKVAVGSYPDANSAAAALRELEKQGFKAILVRWSPE